MKHKLARFFPQKRTQPVHKQVPPSLAMIAYGWRLRTALHMDVESDPYVCEPDLPNPQAAITARITLVLEMEGITVPNADMPTWADLSDWRTETMQTAVVGAK